ncbi:MAG: electron transfer flavoprotein subunit beta/FixA family protein [Anaerolineales bacterium]
MNVKIIVCVKQVPDTAATMSVEGGEISWGDASLIINPWDEYALEAALVLQAEHGGEVIALGMGKEEETEAIKHALAMGADEAVQISDPQFAGADAVAVAKILAAAIEKIGSADLVLMGQESVDSQSGILTSQVGRALGWPIYPLVSAFSEFDPDGGSFQVRRAMEEGKQIVNGKLPAVISVTKDYGEPRYPSFMGIRKASRATYPTWGADDLGIDPPTSVVSWPEVQEPLEREVVTEIIEGETPQEKAEKLAEKLIEEKVL